MSIKIYARFSAGLQKGANSFQRSAVSKKLARRGGKKIVKKPVAKKIPATKKSVAKKKAAKTKKVNRKSVKLVRRGGKIKPVVKKKIVKKSVKKIERKKK